MHISKYKGNFSTLTSTTFGVEINMHATVDTDMQFQELLINVLISDINYFITSSIMKLIFNMNLISHY